MWGDNAQSTDVLKIEERKIDSQNKAKIERMTGQE
jgi:hypothetical protein